MSGRYSGLIMDFWPGFFWGALALILAIGIFLNLDYPKREGVRIALLFASIIIALGGFVLMLKALF